MSYVEYNQNIVVHLPKSAALNRIEYDPIEKEVLVYYEGNKDRGYTHKVNGKENFDGLISLIEYQSSGYYGYKQWQDNMQKQFRRNDFAAFSKYFDGLTKHQKDNFRSWAKQMLRGLY